MAKLILHKQEKREQSYSLIRCSKQYETLIKDMAKDLNTYPARIVDALFEFALDRVEISEESGNLSEVVQE